MTNKQKRITLETLHEMLDGMSVELAEKYEIKILRKTVEGGGKNGYNRI